MTSASDTPRAPASAAGFYSAEHYQVHQLQPENSVGYLMRKVMSSIRTQADAQLAIHGLTYAQWMPLFKLSLYEQTTVASLARDLETDPASMTRSLDRMEAKGLVQRYPHDTDRRVTMVRITPQGRTIVADLMEQAKEHEHRVLQPFGLKRAESLKVTLRRIIELHRGPR